MYVVWDLKNNCNYYLYTYLWMTFNLTIWQIYHVDQQEFEVRHHKE